MAGIASACLGELNRARAIENQVYVRAVNGVGTYRNVPAGRSALLDPMGEYIVRGGDAEEILYGEYDSERCTKCANT